MKLDVEQTPAIELCLDEMERKTSTVAHFPKAWQ